MKHEKLKEYFEKMDPDKSSKEKMLYGILEKKHEEADVENRKDSAEAFSVKTGFRKSLNRKTGIAAAVIGVLMLIVILAADPFHFRKRQSGNSPEASGETITLQSKKEPDEPVREAVDPGQETIVTDFPLIRLSYENEQAMLAVETWLKEKEPQAELLELCCADELWQERLETYYFSDESEKRRETAFPDDQAQQKKENEKVIFVIGTLVMPKGAVSEAFFPGRACWDYIWCVGHEGDSFRILSHGPSGMKITDTAQLQTSSGVSLSRDISEGRFSRQDIQEAKDAAVSCFDEKFENCTLWEIWYCGDQDNEMLTGEGQYGFFHMDDIMILYSAFVTGEETAASICSNALYSGFMWIMGRKAGEKWRVLDWGY